MASNVSAIVCASKRREPLKSRCSMKWETPARSSRSSREPTSIQKPSETERTPVTRSETTRSPLSSSLSVTFCTVDPLRRRLRRRLRSFPCSVEPTHLRMVGEDMAPELGQHGVDSVDDDARSVVGRLGEEQCELVAADAESGVGPAQRPRENAR